MFVTTAGQSECGSSWRRHNLRIASPYPRLHQQVLVPFASQPARSSFIRLPAQNPSMPSTATIRSSVRPKSSKQPWGTIMHPEFGMGYQKMTNYEIEQTVSRLYQIPIKDERAAEKPMMKEMSQEGLTQMVKRLTELNKEVPDNTRTLKASEYKGMGILNSFAWKGYN